MKAIGFAALLGSFIFFSSCQREVDPTIPNSPQTDSSTLSKIIVFDTTRPPGMDTLFVLTFNYDAQKRLASRLFVEMNISTGYRYEYLDKYRYNGNDTLPVIVNMSEPMSTGLDSTLHFLSYNNGFVVKDSMVDYIPGPVVAVTLRDLSTLSPGLYLTRTFEYDMTTGTRYLSDSITYTRTVINGNVINAIDTLWGIPLPQVIYRNQFAYDNKPNPFHPHTIWYLGYWDNVEELTDIDFGSNNFINASYSELFPFTWNVVETYQYNYNSAGYPVMVRMTGTDGDKAIFFYTKL